jgi:predicted ATPase
VGLQDQGTGQLAGRVADYLADRDLLLIIDNCEHLLTAAAGLIRTLLRAAPLLRVLVTSREPLGAEGEVCWLVPSLGLPAEDAGLAVAEAAAADAVRLFLGEIAYRRGDLRAARGHLEEGLALARAICKVCTQNLLAELAEVAAAQGGDPAEVTSLRAERDRLQVELGLPPRDPWTD